MNLMAHLLFDLDSRHRETTEVEHKIASPSAQLLEQCIHQLLQSQSSTRR